MKSVNQLFCPVCSKNICFTYLKSTIVYLLLAVGSLSFNKDHTFQSFFQDFGRGVAKLDIMGEWEGKVVSLCKLSTCIVSITFAFDLMHLDLYAMYVCT